MAPLDRAVVRLLGDDITEATVTGISGGMSSASAHRIDCKSNGQVRRFFLKTASGEAARTMFAGEHASLNAIHNAVPSLAPASLGHGRLEDSPTKYFLVTDYVEFASQSSVAPEDALIPQLAKLHTTPAPTPEGFDKPMFGFPLATFCGDTPQPNDFNESWSEFYKYNRLLFILSQCEDSNGPDQELSRLVNGICDTVVPYLLGARLNDGKRIVPVVVHGDLWSGNTTSGRIGSGGRVRDLVFDPSATYAHGEYDLGIIKMFPGGSFAKFVDEYHKHCPATEPASEFDQRVKLYELCVVRQTSMLTKVPLVKSQRSVRRFVSIGRYQANARIIGLGQDAIRLYVQSLTHDGEKHRSKH